MAGGSPRWIRPERTAEALAVVDGRIVAVGPDAALRRWIGPRTRVIDLRGRTVTPGFGDAHVHPVTSGLDRLRCDLTGARGLAAYLEVIAAYAASHPDEAWIRGSGWSMADFPGGIADRADLDRIVPDRPVYLETRDGHTGWVNSVALARAGITDTTPDPRDGRIERDADGTRDRHAPGGCAGAGLRRPATGHGRGARGRAPARPGGAPRARHHQLAGRAGRGRDRRRVHDDGRPRRAHAPGSSARSAGTRRAARSRSRSWSSGGPRTARPRYAPTSVKFFADGILENFTGAVLEPYLDRDGLPTSNLGDSLIEPAAFGAAVTRLDALGFQVHVHAIGDRAVRDALDAVEVARRANGRERYPAADRASPARPSGRPRAVPCARRRGRHPGLLGRARGPDGGADDPVRGSRAGRPDVSRSASLLRAGATIAMGSDWSVSTADPLLQMEVAVERVSDEHRGRRPAFLPDERIDLDDALAGFTRGSAWANHLDGEVGSIEVGKAADLAVLDRDLFDRGAGAIGEARVVATFIDGEAVYERP